MNRRQFLRTSALAGAAVASTLGLDAWAVEPRRMEVTHYAVTPPAWPSAPPAAPLKVAFMSDFHRSKTTSIAWIREAVRLCQAENADVILLGGDFISSDPSLARECAEALGRLKAPLGVFFVLGNHDHWHHPERVRAALEAQGLKNLTNRNVLLRPGVFLIGLDDCWAGRPDYAAAFRGTDHGARIVLTHNPRIFPRIRDRGCVVVCGHTHGGQVNIPLVPNPYLRSWKTYIEGWFHEESSHMYVNRGIGTLGLPIRFRCRPEITVLTLGLAAGARP